MTIPIHTQLSKQEPRGSQISSPSEQMQIGKRALSQKLRDFAVRAAPSGLYGLVGRGIDFACAIPLLGINASIRLIRSLPSKSRSQENRQEQLFRFKSTNLQHTFCIRRGTSDTIEAFYTIIRQAYGKYLPSQPPQFILDAGANIGTTSAWLLSLFPDSRIVAVEPDSSNFALLQMNCAPFESRVSLVQAAVWPTPANFSLRIGYDHNAIRVDESADGICPGVTVPMLMEQFGFPRIDFFKCDIEGAERELFSVDSDQWLRQTRFIVVETHGSDCLDAVLEATSRHGFTYQRFRDLRIFARPDSR
jgi:FkbM family methyltransferase